DGVVQPGTNPLVDRTRPRLRPTARAGFAEQRLHHLFWRAHVAVHGVDGADDGLLLAILLGAPLVVVVADGQRLGGPAHGDPLAIGALDDEGPFFFRGRHRQGLAKRLDEGGRWVAEALQAIDVFR